MKIKKKNVEDASVRYNVNSYITLLSKIIKFESNTKLLEIGCGTGHFLYYFDKLCSAYGIDISEEAIANCSMKNVSIMDCTNLQYVDDSFDIVFCHNVLHHVDNIEKAISEIKRVAKDYAIIIEPNRYNPINLAIALTCKDEHKILKFSKKYWKNLMNQYHMPIRATITFGMPIPNLIPKVLLPLFKLFHKKSPLAWDNFIIVQTH